MAARVPFNRSRPKSPPVVTPPSASARSSRGPVSTSDGRPELHKRQREQTDEADRLARQFAAGAKYGPRNPRRS